MKNIDECFVVLGHLMSATGELSNESKRRVLKLVECIKDKENQLIFFCGWDYRNDSNIKLAKALSDFFIKQKPSAHKIILLESSRDTVGDAVLLKYYFENHIAEKKINVITSNYHIDRSQRIFDFVFYQNDIFMHAAKIEFNKQNDIHEYKSLEAFEETFKDINPGDIDAIYERLISSHPYYNGKIHARLD